MAHHHETEVTPEESKWLKQLQRVLNKCPSKRLGFYTTGGPTVSVYDKDKEEQICALQDAPGKGVDFCSAVDECNAGLGAVTFPSEVCSTAG